ncbi:hypothetical protein [Leptospira ryugenii]|uniref:hypothetical protein n=1 Tax=Leptospira ryugenii TaxID=1917863 RepID=UPI00143549C0|nr:hypothetical protein [Leptospira ryugenii]
MTNELFLLSETRGKESAGLAIKSNVEREIGVYKDSLPASELIKTKGFNEFWNQYFKNWEKHKSGPNYIQLLGHTRLVTNGFSSNNENNQPVTKSGGVAVHNGIIVNVDKAWTKHKDLTRVYEVDTEFLLDLYMQRLKTEDALSALKNTLPEIEGSVSTGIITDKSDLLLLYTNTGSLYYYSDTSLGIFIFSSERFILNHLLESYGIQKNDGEIDVKWLHPGSVLVLDPNNLNFKLLKFTEGSIDQKVFQVGSQKKFQIKNFSPSNTSTAVIPHVSENQKERLLEFNLEKIRLLKRCTRCVLPETFPFIYFDKDGVCNYCKHYKKQEYLGIEKLNKYADEIRNPKAEPDCLVAFSGGRDSSYSLHYVKNILKLNPIAYTYDWGMVTDLARRNQARICGKLGIEHILVSADIKMKREYIRKNVAAWLKRPSLGTIPLFMAGDKQFFYYAYYLRKINSLRETILCENLLERTNFKSGFCGIEPYFDDEHNFTLTTSGKLKMLLFYGKEFLSNPSYLNSSLYDSAKAFLTYYFIPHSYFNLFDYLPWNEKEIETTLINEYDWELSPDTTTTWRIGDGTASFYNYIYYNVAGFSEFETFRSNQIREGMIDRKLALEKIEEENRPRFESILWYLNTIHLDFDNTINTINKIPKLYS